MLTYVKYDFLVLITIKVIMKNCVVTGLTIHARSLFLFIKESLSSVKSIVFFFFCPQCERVQMLILPQRLLKAGRSSRRESGSARLSSPLWSKCVPAQAKPFRPEPQRCSNRREAREHAFPQTNPSRDKLFTSQRPKT